MQHLDEGTIHAWLDGALASDEASRVQLHVASCETCSEAVAEARGLIAASSRILTALDDVPRVAGAREGRRDLGGRRWFPVTSRIAAVIALVVAGGALALAVRSPSARFVALEAEADRETAVTLAALDSPAAETPVVAQPEPIAPERPLNAPGRGGIGAVSGGAPARATSRERDLASEQLADSEPLTLAQAQVASAAGAPPAAPAPTDDSARVPVLVADANRVTAPEVQAEGRSAASEKVAGALGVRRSAAEASARFAQPAAPQPQRRVAPEPSVPALLTEERLVEAGRDVVRRVYRVEETLVTLDEHAPVEREERAERAVPQERLRRLESRAETAPRADSVAAPMTTIRWVDARGAQFTLSGAASREQLERFRRLLGH